MNKSELKPALVFEQFAKINEIPRPSKHEENMIEFLKSFGEAHQLETLVDETGNVLIRKAATPGYEHAETIILQSHMDMVCDKLVDVDFDFHKDAIQTYVDGEWLKAKGTTLGADDGIGCAIELAILASNDIEHGPIECVFTRDEETGLTGAHGMKAGFMTGKMLINLDSEDEGEIFVSCAGGQTTHATFLENEKLDGSLRLVSFNSGKMHNAIPRDGKIVFAVKNADKEQVRADWNIFASEVEDEFHVTEQAMQFNMSSTDAAPVIEKAVADKFVMALQAVDNGPLTTCQDEAIAWMVETSSNVASVMTDENSINIVASQRSNVMSNLENMTNTVKAAFLLAGAEVTVGDKYPAWMMRANSELTDLAVKAYEKLFGKKPLVKGIHAGLECGLFSERYPELDMVSFGPTLRNVHTPDEALLIPTVEMVWDHLLEILRSVAK